MSTADFERVLGARPWARGEHFSVHHLADRPAGAEPAGARLSTGLAPSTDLPVDDSPRLWLGMVVPKRHARRAVTRNLLKRQMRAALDRHAERLPHGLWVLRLRAPFDKARFPSAASPALRDAARAELDQLLARERAAS